ncbi:MAG TPA: hypothetical protein VHA78_02700 [Candidatus Peribacteraceae bacterium]|nr:hypothetical protein [Candidatus Peribacteraceae bacterium]
MPDVPANSGEQLVLISHESWVKYVRLVAVYLLLLLGSILFFYIAALSAFQYDLVTQIALLLGVFLVLVDHHWFFMAIMSQAENQVIVTTDRVIWIRHRIFFDEEMHEYAFEKMKFVVSEKKTFLQYLFQFGTLKFESGTPIPYVPHPSAVAMAIEQAMGLT